MAQLTTIRAAKQELRKKLRPLLSAMMEAQHGVESEVLSRKVSPLSCCLSFFFARECLIALISMSSVLMSTCGCSVPGK